MMNFLVRRLLYALLVLVGVNILTFTLFFTVNSTDNIARLALGGKRVSAEAIEKWKAEHGYDRPLWFDTQARGVRALTNTVFFDRSLRLMTLNFGASDSGRDIGYEVRTRIVASFSFAAPVLVLAVFVSVLFSLWLVFFRATALDFWGTVSCVVLMSISSLFYIIMAQWVFGKWLRWVPLSGYGTGLDALRFLLLPVCVGVIYQLGAHARLFRAMLLEEMYKDYVRSARAKGLTEAAVLLRHVLRNAGLPMVTHIGAMLPYAFLGSIIFESFFGIPGLGAYVIEAIAAQDFAVVHAMVFLGSALYILAYLLTDLVYSWVDPRVRLE